MPIRQYVRDDLGQFAHTPGSGIAAAFTPRELVHTPIEGMTLQGYLRHQAQREQHGIPSGKETAATQAKRLGGQSTTPLDTEARKAAIESAKQVVLTANPHLFPGWDAAAGRWRSRGRGSGFDEFYAGIDGKGPHAQLLKHVAQLDADYHRDLDHNPETHQAIARALNDERARRRRKKQK